MHKGLRTVVLVKHGFWVSGLVGLPVHVAAHASTREAVSAWARDRERRGERACACGSGRAWGACGGDALTWDYCG